MDARVLVVEDDATVAEVVSTYLGNAGFDVARAADGATALRLADTYRPDLIILDLMLPGIDGREVCRRLRAGGTRASGTSGTSGRGGLGGVGRSAIEPEPEPVAIIMLTALGAEDDRVFGLELGADDYVTKPFSPRELVLRVKSVLRRGRGATEDRSLPQVLVDGPFRLDTAAHTASRDGAELALTVREFDLLAFLIAHPHQAYTREQLLEKVWGWTVGDHSTVTVHVRRLREKIEADPAHPGRLVTVWGVGYRWDPEPAGAPAEALP